MDTRETSGGVLSPSTLTLPKGGGTVQGMGQTFTTGGNKGLANASVPLPVSPGRGFAPVLALDYSSGTGNGLFGQGWDLSLSPVTRSTRLGVPHYTPEDTFIGPDGEELVVGRDSSGKVMTTSRDRYAGQTLDGTYTVTRYYSRVEGAFHRVEYWSLQGQVGFWLIHDASGALHCFGRTPQARLADPSAPGHVAEWWLEESLSSTGHVIRYEYRKGSPGVPDRIFYGNVTPAATLDVWKNTVRTPEQWHFTLVFDYGERGTDFATPPAYDAGAATATPRQDTPVRYRYGFADKTDLLCHQVLMFHTFPALNAGKPTLVNRLLLDYDESPVLAQLISARSVSYEADRTPVSLPPLDFRYTPFVPTVAATCWQPLEALADIRDGRTSQLVDLYGEGLPGLLYKDNSGWYYRAPERGATPESVVYGETSRLPVSPSLDEAGMALLDLNDDGRLDWLVQRPGLAGYFTLSADKRWSNFIPYDAWPAEFMSARAQLVDLTGAGLNDLALIGPRSVRLYVNQRNGFGAPRTIMQEESVTLPVDGRDTTQLVAFSDVLGSGQQHLISLRHDKVTCWPNLGHGRFGTPCILPGLTLDAATFNPDQVFFADIDGSGATDVVYAEPDHLLIFRNLSGHAFAAPLILPLPAGVRYDRLCDLSAVDLLGQGVTSLMLTVPHMATRHWICSFVSEKPYLLAGFNSNMGADTELRYRSSAQAWLDEKKNRLEATCHLPFPVQVLSRVENRDEITGNLLTQQYRYGYGRYDGAAREFRGFGLIEMTDTDENARGTGGHDNISSTSLTRTWYHTGDPDDEANLPEVSASLGLWMPYHLQQSRLTSWNTAESVDTALILTVEDRPLRAELYRALQGRPLRQDIYGQDGTPASAIPYRVTTIRYQVRLVQAGAIPVVLPVVVETLEYSYERIASDPVITHSASLIFDAFGTPLHTVGIAYPRRAVSEVSTTAYPATLPEGIVQAARDTQQEVLHLTEYRQQVYHLTQPDAWRLGLADWSRTDVLSHPAKAVPVKGLSLESLSDQAGLLGATHQRTYAGQLRVDYGGTPTLAARVCYTEEAVFDDVCLKAFDGTLDGEARVSQLKASGYVQVAKMPGVRTESDKVWVARRGLTEWHDLTGFYLPSATRDTLLTGKTTLTWDAEHCVVTAVKDAAGLTTTARYDYRFMTPWQLTDVNDNVTEVLTDALGRVVATSFYGKEAGKAAGFKPVSAFRPTIRALASLADNLVTTLDVASWTVTDAFSWMGNLPEGQISEADRAVLSRQHLITPEGYLRAAARRQLSDGGVIDGVSAAGVKKMKQVGQMPVCGAVLTADRYPGQGQQIRCTLMFSDGFSRVLQTAVRHPPGEACVRENGGKLRLSSGMPVQEAAQKRWAVSGRVEYNNKGLPVRVYQPFFVNDWRYVQDDALRVSGYADTHHYDALGRANAVHTAKGYWRRESIYPWFVMSEDENDTLI